MLAGGGRRHAGDLVPAHRGRLVDALKAHAGTGLVVAWVVSEGRGGRRVDGMNSNCMQYFWGEQCCGCGCSWALIYV